MRERESWELGAVEDMGLINRWEPGKEDDVARAVAGKYAALVLKGKSGANKEETLMRACDTQ